jgi:probable F420-dependent oxidoreductase
MRLGAIYPQYDMPDDPGVIRDFAQAVEGIGYADLGIYEHVLGADRSQRPEFRGPYDSTTTFHEPFVLFGYLAGLTRSITLTTCIVILPQRQTALVAKQAAEVQLLSGGRFRLGVGSGWNPVEFEGLGMDFHTRGAREAEQVGLLRELWSNEVVNFEGRWDRVVAAGIRPLPPTPIPVWFGGTDERALRRAAKLGDGWFPNVRPERGVPLIEQIRGFVREVGRDPSTFGIEPRVSFANTTPEQRRSDFEAWRAAGVDTISVVTLGAGFTKPEEHLAAMQSFYDEFSGA